MILGGPQFVAWQLFANSKQWILGSKKEIPSPSNDIEKTMAFYLNKKKIFCKSILFSYTYLGRLFIYRVIFVTVAC